MIARFLAMLMSVTLPVQGLAVPHSHGENVIGQGTDHDRKPHFHLGYGHHHGHQRHSHDEHDCPCDKVDDDFSKTPAQQHDDDAVFVSGELVVVDHAQVRVPIPDECVALAINLVSPSLALDTFHRWLQEPPPDIGGLPIFLKTASLRL